MCKYVKDKLMSDTPNNNMIITTFEVAGPVDDKIIDSAELLLKVKFPQEYRDFLRDYGAAMGAGFDIAGLAEEVTDEPPLWDDVVEFTRNMRDAVGKVGSYSDLVALSNDGMDITFYLRTDDTHCGEVLALGPGVETLVAKSFNEFLNKLSKGILMQKKGDGGNKK